MSRRGVPGRAAVSCFSAGNNDSADRKQQRRRARKQRRQERAAPRGAGRGELTLYPPTWVTLHGLTGHGDAAQMMDATRAGGIRIFETVARRGADGPVLLWQGDAEYHLDGAAPPDGRHRLEIGVLP